MSSQSPAPNCDPPPRIRLKLHRRALLARLNAADPPRLGGVSHDNSGVGCEGEGRFAIAALSAWRSGLRHRSGVAGYMHRKVVKAHASWYRVSPDPIKFPLADLVLRMSREQERVRRILLIT